MDQIIRTSLDPLAPCSPFALDVSSPGRGRNRLYNPAPAPRLAPAAGRLAAGALETRHACRRAGAARLVRAAAIGFRMTADGAVRLHPPLFALPAAVRRLGAR